MPNIQYICLINVYLLLNVDGFSHQIKKKKVKWEAKEKYNKLLYAVSLCRRPLSSTTDTDGMQSDKNISLSFSCQFDKRFKRPNASPAKYDRTSKKKSKNKNGFRPRTRDTAHQNPPLAINEDRL